MKTLMRRKIVLLSFCLTAALIAKAEPRTFTSTDGRTLDAEVTAATPDMVTLKMVSGQTIATQISRFSSGDQEYIATWRKEHPVAIKYAFAASYTKAKTNSSKKKNGDVTETTDTWICNMKIANRSGQTLENATIKYNVYYNQIEDKKPVLRKLSDEAPLAVIKNLQELVIPTKEIKLTTSQLDGGYYYLDGSKSRQRDALAGISLSIFHDGKEVFIWSSGNVPAGSGAPKEGKTESVFGK